MIAILVMIMMKTNYRKTMNSDDDNTNGYTGYIVMILMQIVEYNIDNEQGQVASSLGFKEVLLGLRVPGFAAKGSWPWRGPRDLGAKLGEGLT